jgi:hypothetical protein
MYKRHSTETKILCKWLLEKLYISRVQLINNFKEFVEFKLWRLLAILKRDIMSNGKGNQMNFKNLRSFSTKILLTFIGYSGEFYN